jgi:hypothetical protein
MKKIIFFFLIFISNISSAQSIEVKSSHSENSEYIRENDIDTIFVLQMADFGKKVEDMNWFVGLASESIYFIDRPVERMIYKICLIDTTSQNYEVEIFDNDYNVIGREMKYVNVEVFYTSENIFKNTIFCNVESQLIFDITLTRRILDETMLQKMLRYKPVVYLDSQTFLNK